MEWLIEPISGIRAISLDMVEGSCSGDGTVLNSCSCKGGLVNCQCSGGLKATANA
ncbi:MAG TPA: hypothetical protein VF532_23695 [Candidatus Angelobacter sp.]